MLPQAHFGFPQGFLWGTATSSHQVEGNNVNNTWYAWEKVDGHTINNYRSGLACDWWGGRWRQDFDRAAEDHHNALRLSIEWSRVQPAPDRWDEHALDHYRQMLRGLDERAITPMVTLHHYTDPIWLAEMGGWENSEVVQLYADYVRKTVEALKGYVDLWCTFQEPNIYATLGYRDGEFPPGDKSTAEASKVKVNLLRGHTAAYRIIKEMNPQAKVGITINHRSFIPSRPGDMLDRLTAKALNYIYRDPFSQALVDGKLRLPLRSVHVPGAAGAQDFIGLNYYTSDTVRFAFNAASMFTLPENADISQTGFIISQPEGLFKAIEWATQFNLPIYITENGTEDAMDEHRQRYIIEHVMQMWRAVNFNFPVKGYFHWSLVDNFEWERGWAQRFGLWALDTTSQERFKRPSADLYATICRENGLSTEMVRQYAPEIFNKLFPV